jgi:predicted MFS family arabinose efflux permease
VNREHGPPADNGEEPVERVAVVPHYAWLVVLLVLLAGAAAALNQFKVPPLIPLLSQRFHLDLGNAGWLMSIFAITGFLMAFPAGVIMRRIGPKATGLVALGSLVAGGILGAFSTTTSMLLTSRFIEGVGLGLIAVVGPTIIASWFPPEQQGAPMGVWATWVPLGGISMYILAPILAASSGWQAVWWADVAFVTISLLLFAAFLRMPTNLTRLPPSTERKSSAKPNIGLGKALTNDNIWLLGIAFCCYNTFIFSLMTFLPTFLSSQRGYSLADASFTTSLGLVTAIFSCPIAGWVSDRLGSRKLPMVVALLLLSASLLFSFRITGLAIPAYIIIMLGFVGSIVPATTFAAAPKVMGDPQLAGIGLAVVIFTQNVGAFVGPVLFGTVVDWMGWTVAGYVMIPFLIIGSITAWFAKLP